MRTIAINDKGVTVIAAIVAVLIMASLGAGMAYIISSNSRSVVQQVTSDQVFYSDQAGMEYALKKSIDGSADTAWTKNFAGGSVNIVRSGGTITVVGTKMDAAETHTITDPGPPVSDCLTVNTAGASVAGSTLSGITISKKATCSQNLIVTSMDTTSWTVNAGELLNTIDVDGATKFSGSGSSGGVFPFSPTVALSDFSNHSVAMVWNSTMLNHTFTVVFNYTYASQNKSVSTVINLNNAAACFSWGTSAARLTYDTSLWHQLTGTTVGNSCTVPITVQSMVVSWTPSSPSRNLNTMIVNGATVFSGTSASGATSTTNFSIPASTTQNFNSFSFSDEMLGRNYSVTWNFSDGTSASTSLNLFASPENTCLEIDATNAQINPVNLKQIIGLKIQNTCGADIGMASLTMSWSGDTTQRLTQAIIVDTDGSNTYSGTYASGSAMDFGTNDLYLRDGDAASNVTSLTFLNNVTSISRTLLFTMPDGTTKSVAFTPSTQANCLTVNTAGSSWSGNGRDWMNITVTNSCSSAITWTGVTIDWSPTSTRTVTVVRVNNVNVWTGNQARNTLITLTTPVALAASQTKTISYFRFSGDMTTGSRYFTLTFTMQDASTKVLSNLGPY